MLNNVLKKLGISSDVEKEEVDMNTQTQASVELAQHESIVAQLTAQVAEATAVAATFKEQLELAQAKLAEADAYNAQMAAQAKEQVRVARLAKVEAVVGSEKATTAMATLESMDEASFEAVVGMMAATYQAESQSALFTEAGLSAEPKATEEKDAVQRLADNLAAQFKNT